jgi:predicted site-specific integrase-resolvase
MARVHSRSGTAAQEENIMRDVANRTTPRVIIYLRADSSNGLDNPQRRLRRRMLEAGIDRADAVVAAETGSGRSAKRRAFRRRA